MGKHTSVDDLDHTYILLPTWMNLDQGSYICTTVSMCKLLTRRAHVRSGLQ